MVDLTALVLSYNEKQNIGRTIERLTWLPRVVVLDSHSSDETCDIARSFSNVELLQRQFDTHATQWNYGLSLITTAWVLTLDADYLVTEQFAREIQSLAPVEPVSGYSAEFDFIIADKALRCSIYPARVVLFKTQCGHYVDEGHTQTLKLVGRVDQLRSKIIHDDRKPLSHWIVAQDNYARIEARHLLGTSPATLSRQDRLRLHIFYAAPAMFLYLLFVRGLILDGWRGWYYVSQRVIAELLLSLRLLIERHKLEAFADHKPG